MTPTGLIHLDKFRQPETRPQNPLTGPADLTPANPAILRRKTEDRTCLSVGIQHNITIT